MLMACSAQCKVLLLYYFVLNRNSSTMVCACCRCESPLHPPSSHMGDSVSAGSARVCVPTRTITLSSAH